MANYNKVIMAGHLTKDPQLSYLPSQMSVVDFGIATSHKYKDKESVCFIDCRAFGKVAELIHKYLKKGSGALIEGRLDFDQWTTQDGTKRSKHRITVDNLQFLDPKKQSEPELPNQQKEEDIPF